MILAVLNHLINDKTNAVIVIIVFKNIDEYFDGNVHILRPVAVNKNDNMIKDLKYCFLYIV